MILIALELRSVDLSVSSCFTSRSDNFEGIVSHTWPEVRISFPFEICAFAVSKLTREFVNKKVSNTNRKTSKAAMLCPLYSLKISIYKGTIGVELLSSIENVKSERLLHGKC